MLTFLLCPGLYGGYFVYVFMIVLLYGKTVKSSQRDLIKYKEMIQRRYKSKENEEYRGIMPGKKPPLEKHTA